MDEGELFDAFLAPARVWSRAEVLSRPSPVPRAPGVYGWWFRTVPGDIDTSDCRRWNSLTLLYTGISPKRPPTNGRPPSKGQLRQRLQTHYNGNAEGSTLRKSLGCLLASQLKIELRRVGSGGRRTFGHGEAALSEWMQANAQVSWVETARPWDLEDRLIRALDLPLNLDGNTRNRFHPELTRVRAGCVRTAQDLPVLPNPSGRGGRAHLD